MPCQWFQKRNGGDWILEGYLKWQFFCIHLELHKFLYSALQIMTRQHNQAVSEQAYSSKFFVRVDSHLKQNMSPGMAHGLVAWTCQNLINFFLGIGEWGSAALRMDLSWYTCGVWYTQQDFQLDILILSVTKKVHLLHRWETDFNCREIRFADQPVKLSILHSILEFMAFGAEYTLYWSHSKTNWLLPPN